MRSKLSKPREVREGNGEKGRDKSISIDRFFPSSLPSLTIPSRVIRRFFFYTYGIKIVSTSLPMCFFKGRKGRAVKKGLIDNAFSLPLSLIFKVSVREVKGKCKGSLGGVF